MSFFLSLLLIVSANVFASTDAFAASAPKTDDEKAFYSIGANMAVQLSQANPISDAELDQLVQGLRDGIHGDTLAVDQQEGATLVRAMLKKRQEIAMKAEKEASSRYLAAEAKKKGAQKTESGLIYTELVPGTGASPTATDKVRVHYHGTLRDGTVFDSSVDRGSPAEFPLNRVIPCWTEGVAKMKVGGKSRLVCPAEIAYGDRSTGRIPGGAALTFEVELLDIVE
ncbi:MAG TPA: FKBP-type peptidyl-prolyl cis-trans isomerase [Deltaproteobacteria bacterium]|nr:FKBP-type peptidyl-prolyl cis-trans isomerase [Deltaproteobacteria bacterium]